MSAKKSNFENLDDPTDYDLEFLRIVWLNMNKSERSNFDLELMNYFSEWDLTAFRELTNSSLFVNYKF